MRHSWLLLGAGAVLIVFCARHAFSAEAAASATAPASGKIVTLFDGKTLDGWIQEPSGRPTNLSGDSISDFPALVKKIAAKSDPLSAFVYDELDDAGKASLEAFDPTDAAKTKVAKAAVVKSLNKLVAQPSLYDEKWFKDAQLRPETVELRKKDPQGKDLARLNRMLLEDAYPKELIQAAATPWIVKDGAMASTGAGRGVIYTKDDYSRFRLMFTMRQVVGNHQPCILIFCSRPTEGEKPLDALGGIQFQVPNGGHWDYRPGQNKSGVGFTNPNKPKFNNKEWSRIEVLADATKATARMAVASPVGSKAIEVLDYNIPEAGKTGPIAWQMHNGGIFDEYKDVTIEIDPVVDELITVN